MNIPRSGVIDPETINTHDLCYRCSKHGPDGLFGKSRIRDFNYELNFTEIINLISSLIQINTLFKTKDKIKRRICDKIIHTAMIITVDIHKMNKKFSVTVQPKNTCKL